MASTGSAALKDNWPEAALRQARKEAEYHRELSGLAERRLNWLIRQNVVSLGVSGSLYEIWGCDTPEQVLAIIDRELAKEAAPQ